MPNFTYNRDIPDAPNNPSNDQGPMKVNTNSTDDLINEDHYSFNDTNGGLHKQVRLVDLLSIPGSLVSGEGTLYTKLATSTGVSQESNLFYSPDASGNEYQLTRTITASFSSLFAGNVQNYNGVGVNFFGGWTFLPGGLLFQYGALSVNPMTSTGSITFPVTFSAQPFNIQLTIASKNGGTSTSRTLSVQSGTISSTGFSWNIESSTSDYRGFFWTAIGK